MTTILDLQEDHSHHQPEGQLPDQCQNHQNETIVMGKMAEVAVALAAEVPIAMGEGRTEKGATLAVAVEVGARSEVEGRRVLRLWLKS